jgi:FMN-dependent NADH-azoreductase
MNQILTIEVSPREAESASRLVTEKLSTRLREEFPGAKFVYRDLAKDSIPHLDNNTLKALSSKIPEEVQVNKEFAYQSDQLTEELQESDLLVISTPMWNCSIPSVLKAWLDLVVRPGKTFNYTGTGVLGLANAKKAFIVVSSGGVFTEGPFQTLNNLFHNLCCNSLSQKQPPPFAVSEEPFSWHPGIPSRFSYTEWRRCKVTDLLIVQVMTLGYPIC